jgi:hypothetical protein
MPEPISIITEVGEQDIILPFKYANKLNNQIELINLIPFGKTILRQVSF